MKRFPRSAAWLAALCLPWMAAPALSAVATGNIRVSGSRIAGYTIAYDLAEDATQMQVKVYTSSDTLVRTFSVTDPAALTQGRHTSDVLWNGKNDANANVPVGDYYVTITTSGAAVPELTVRTNPVMQEVNFQGKAWKDGRFYYGLGVNTVADSPYKNTGYISSLAQNASQLNGTWLVAPSGHSSGYLPTAPVLLNLNWTAVDVLPDGTVVHTGQSTPWDVLFTTPDGTEIKRVKPEGGFDINTRGMRAFGTKDNTTLVYIDVDSTTVPPNVGGVSTLTIGSGPVEPQQVAVPIGGLPTTARSLDAKADLSAIYVSGWSTDGAGGNYVQKWNRQGDGSYAKDTGFNWIQPRGEPGRIFVCLSPDEQTLWVASNLTPATADIASRFIQGVNPITGAQKGENYILPVVDFEDLGFAPEQMAVSANGNLYVQAYTGMLTGTTGDAIAIVAPPSGVTTDTTRSFPFSVVDDTTVDITAGPTAEVTLDSATIKWTTDLPSNSVVMFGTVSGAYGEPIIVDDLVMQHSIVLRNLTQGTTYYYKVESHATGMTSAYSTEKTFKTYSPMYVYSETFSATQTTAALGLNTSVPVAAVVRYGTDRDARNQTLNVARPANTINFTGLAAGTTYFYNLELTAEDGNTLVTPVSAFTTALAAGTGVTTVAHTAVTDLTPSQRVNLQLGGAGNLLRLQAQGVPGPVIAGTPLPEPRYYHGVAVLNNYLYVLGGRNNLASGNTSDKVYVAPINADGTIGAWSETTPMPTAAMAHNDMVFGYAGHLYKVGGADGSFTSLNTVLYAKQNADGSIGAWKTGTPFPLPDGKDLGSAVVVDGYILIGGGEDNNVSPANDTRQFMSQIQGDGSNGPWFETAPLLSTRWFNRTRYNDHKAYVYGGYNTATWNNQAQIYSAAPYGMLSGPVVDTDNMNDLRYTFATGILGGKIVIAGGRVSPNTPVKVIDYAQLLADGTTGPWVVSTAEIQNIASDNDGKAYNNNLYAIGGRTVFAGGAAAAATPDVNIIPMVADPQGPAYAFAGTLDSQVIDLGAVQNLDRLTVNATGGDVEVRYRFAGANAVFSDWMTLSSMDQAISGGARYFQYQLVLRGDGTSSPTVNGITLRVQNASLPPSAVDALRIVGGLTAATAGDLARLDVNHDNAITIQDAVSILRAH